MKESVDGVFAAFDTLEAWLAATPWVTHSQDRKTAKPLPDRDVTYPVVVLEATRGRGERALAG